MAQPSLKEPIQEQKKRQKRVALVILGIKTVGTLSVVHNEPKPAVGLVEKNTPDMSVFTFFGLVTRRRCKAFRVRLPTREAREPTIPRTPSYEANRASRVDGEKHCSIGISSPCSSRSAQLQRDFCRVSASFPLTGHHAGFSSLRTELMVPPDSVPQDHHC